MTTTPYPVACLVTPAGVEYDLAAQTTGLIQRAGKQTFTRPADTTAYTAGDLIAISTTAGSVAPLTFTGVTIAGGTGKGILDSLIIARSTVGICQIRAHVLKTSHAVANGDNSALIFTAIDLDNHFGFVEVSLTSAVNSGALGIGTGLGLPYSVTTDTLYIFLQAIAAFTPASAEVFTVIPIFHRYQ